MNTQVIFKIDKKLKDRAMKKAQDDGVPFASVLKLATRAYVEGQLDVSLVSSESFNSKTRREVTRALADIKAGKNLSPRLTNAKEVMAHLQKT